MAKYIQGKDGKFAGSIGDGKTRIPTPADPRTGRAARIAERTRLNWTAAATTIAARYGLHLSDIADDGPAQGHNQVITWHGPIRIHGVRFHIRHTPEGTGPALYKSGLFGRPLNAEQLEAHLLKKTGKTIADHYAANPMTRNLYPAPEGTRWEVRPHYMSISGETHLVYEVLELVRTTHGDRSVVDSGVIAIWDAGDTHSRGGEFAMAAMAIMERVELGIRSRGGGGQRP